VINDTDRLLESAIGTVRRIAMEIVELPASRWPVAFNVAELNFHEVANSRTPQDGKQSASRN
jgi:hypothetical protein